MTADTITAIKKALEKVYIGEWYISGVKTNGLSVVHNAADSSMFGITAETFEAEYVVAANPFAISELLSTLESLQRENEAMKKDRYDLAYAITGGEDAPGLLDSVPTSQLVEIARNTHRIHSADIDRAMAAEAEAKSLRASQGGLCAKQTLEDIVENSLRIWFGNYDKMDETDKATYRVPMREIVSFVGSSQINHAVKALCEISSLGFVAAKDAPEAHDEAVKIARAALSSTGDTHGN